MYKYILFDLDGTLTDSAPGIIRCVQYALEKCGKGTCPDRELLPFIGPPLTESFQKVCGMTAAEANTALEYYRERFARVGMYENSVYDGIPELLQNLRQAGKTLAVATSKPQLYAEKNPGTLWPRRSLLNNSRPRIQRRAANQSRRDQRSAAAAAPYRC